MFQAERPRRSGTSAPARVLLYSHDTFGLGHLRRSRAIANALAETRPDLSVVIVSGSPVIGTFDFGPGVDYVRIPGVTKLPDGSYCSHNLRLGLDETVALRQSIVLQTAQAFRPDLLIVDKEPTGFRGEILPTLEVLRNTGCRMVLGIRDVLDDPAVLSAEWERKGAIAALDRYYDEIWVYGLEEIYRPLATLPLSGDLARRIVYTGYLRREMPKEAALARYPKLTKNPFLLVTTGGGGDGDALLDWVISAYEADPGIDLPALLVFGPFLDRARRQGFLHRIAPHPKLDAITFDSRIEFLMEKAAGIVAMGGYNTFCEVLSFDKRALIVPRTRPRLEQHIRAVEAERLGLVSLLSDAEGPRESLRMAAALRALPRRARPSDAVVPGLLDGLDAIRSSTSELLAEPRVEHARQAAE